MRIFLQHRGGHDVVRVLIPGQRARFFSPYLIDGCLDTLMQVWRRLQHGVPAKAGDKGRAYYRAVFVHDVRIADDVVHPHYDAAPRERGQTGREKKKGNPFIEIELADLCQNGKRWIIQHNAPLRVRKADIIPAGVKRTDDGRRVDAVFFAGPIPHRVIDQGRCVAIVRRLFGLEFFYKILV